MGTDSKHGRISGHLRKLGKPFDDDDDDGDDDDDDDDGNDDDDGDDDDGDYNGEATLGQS